MPGALIAVDGDPGFVGRLIPGAADPRIREGAACLVDEYEASQGPGQGQEGGADPGVEGQVAHLLFFGVGFPGAQVHAGADGHHLALEVYLILLQGSGLPYAAALLHTEQKQGAVGLPAVGQDRLLFIGGDPFRVGLLLGDLGEARHSKNVLTVKGLGQEPVQYPQDIAHGLGAQVRRELRHEIQEVAFAEIPEVLYVKKRGEIKIDAPLDLLEIGPADPGRPTSAWRRKSQAVA